MPTLNIGGKRVKVSDAFLSLPPDQQQQTVDEIASQLNLGASAPAAAQPALQEVAGDTPEMAARRRQGLAPTAPEFNPSVEGYSPKSGNVDKMGSFGTFATSMAEGVPILGPVLDKIGKAGGAALGSAVTDLDYDQARKQVDDMLDVGREENPLSRLGGNVAGGAAVLGPIGATEAGGYALGLRGGSLLGRAGMSAASGGGISAADTLARGGDLIDAGKSAAFGGILGGALPFAGAGVRAGVQAIGERLTPLLGAMKDPVKEAGRRMGVALRRDQQANQPGVMNAADEAAATQATIPLMNVDRGGETTRALARSVANQNPEARAAIENAASDRFGSQSTRAAEFVRRMFGGNPDDLGFQDRLRSTAQKLNKPAYDLAHAQPGAQSMWTPELAQLMQAPAMQSAAKGATTRGANRSAVEGFQTIKNPFEFGADGSVSMKQGVTPTLRFWDQVKRNLDSEIGKAQRAGDRTEAADLLALKGRLVEILDTAVPEYKTARQGAAVFFGADDALEAGRKFVMQKGSIPEARKAFAKFHQIDKQAFQTGFASELVDRILKSGDRMNVINSVFKSQAARDQIDLVFGPQKLKDLEAYVRVEDIVDRLRGAMGNSTTTRQLVELGLGAGGGYYTTGDLTGAAAGAALVAGPRYVRNKVEQNVMRELGKILTSNDPSAMNRLVALASQTPRYMQALDSLGRNIAPPVARQGAIEGGKQFQGQ